MQFPFVLRQLSSLVIKSRRIRSHDEHTKIHSTTTSCAIIFVVQQFRGTFPTTTNSEPNSSQSSSSASTAPVRESSRCAVQLNFDTGPSLTTTISSSLILLRIILCSIRHLFPFSNDYATAFSYASTCHHRHQITASPF